MQRPGFVRHARDIGFPLDAIRQLPSLVDRPTDSCEPVDGIVQEQLGKVLRRIVNLSAIRDELERLLAGCDGDPVGQCRIHEVPSDHSLCLNDDRRAMADANR